MVVSNMDSSEDHRPVTLPWRFSDKSQHHFNGSKSLTNLYLQTISQWEPLPLKPSSSHLSTSYHTCQICVQQISSPFCILGFLMTEFRHRLFLPFKLHRPKGNIGLHLEQNRKTPCLTQFPLKQCWKYWLQLLTLFLDV